MAWIESHTVLLRHRKVLQLSASLSIPPVLVIGHLHAFWHAVLEQQEDGDLSTWPNAMIAHAAAFVGDVDLFVTELQQKNWLDGLLVHDWIDYAGRYLESKYRSSDPKRLISVWKKHGRKYDKVPGRQCTPEWFRLRQAVLQRDNYICHYCGKHRMNMEVDHVVAVKNGGKDEMSNLVSACRSCNKTKSSKPYASQTKAVRQPPHLTIPDRTKPNPTEPDQPNQPASLVSNAETIRLCELLRGLILTRKRDFKEPPFASWVRDMEILIRIDQRKADEIEAVIRWCQQDPFWQNNILSVGKLRKQYDQLDLKRRANPLANGSTVQLQAGIQAFLHRGSTS